MKCPNCNKEIPDDMPVCGYCGTSLQGDSISDQSTIQGNDDSGGEASVGDMRTMAGRKSSYKKVNAGEIIADRYRIVEVLGAGGMGEVYRCLDMKLNRDVAVKRLLPDMKAGKDGIERFLREGQAIAGLNHQNIVQIHDLGEDEQGHYIVMELIEGGTLKEVIRERKEGKLTIEEVSKVAGQIGRGLSYAHRKGVVHRDIKPGNIMISRDGTAKITDFGLAQIGSESELSMTGYGMGTLDYMPPEQRRDAKHTDHRADIYAFGATLYEMTTGKPPRTIRESEIPKELREVILKAMEAKPEDRFFSVDEMVEALKEPGRAIEVSESDVKQGACPSCGNLNPMEVKFCEECGVGLFEKCPKCEEEIRIGTKHCGYCGVNVAEYKDLLDHLSAAKEYVAKHKYSRAVKEYRNALEIEGDNQEAKQGLIEAEQIVGRIDEIKQEIEQVHQSDKFEDELELQKELIELLPEDDEAKARLEIIPGEIKKRDLIQAAEEAREDSRFEDETNTLNKLLELASDEELNKWISERIVAIPEDIRQRNIENILKQARKELDEGRYSKVLSNCQRVLELDKGDERAIQLQVSARDAIVSRKRKRRIKIGISGLLILLTLVITGVIIRNNMIKRECDRARIEMATQQAKVEKKIGAIKESADKAWLPSDVQRILTVAHDEAKSGRKLEESAEYSEAIMDYKQAASGYGDVLEKLTGIAEEKRICMTAQTGMMTEKAKADNVDISLVPILYEKAEESRKEAGQEYERGQFSKATIMWEKAGREYEESYNWAVAVAAYNEAKEDYETKVKANRELLDKYGGGRWREVKEIAGEGKENIKTPVEGIKSYRKALLKLSGVVEEAEEAKKKAAEAKIKAAEAKKTAAEAKIKAVYENALKQAEEHEGKQEWKKARAEVQEALKSGWGERSAAEALLTRLKYSGENITLNLGGGVKMELFGIPPGSFEMGSNSGDSDEKPVHRVTISQGFWMGKHEVTQEQYRQVMNGNPSHFTGEKNPVAKVSWNDAKKFCKKLTGISEGYLCRLPTEAEWEYAARGGNKSRKYKYSGSDSIESAAWYGSNSGGKTHPVWKKNPNELGLYDMSGNVWEWCEDRYGKYNGGSQRDPKGPQSGLSRVLRGGSWFSIPRFCRSASRFNRAPGNTSSDIGFRVVLVVR